jgi:hypothetical protein
MGSCKTKSVENRLKQKFSLVSAGKSLSSHPKRSLSPDRSGRKLPVDGSRWSLLSTAYIRNIRVWMRSLLPFTNSNSIYFAETF